LLDSTEKW